MQTTNKKFLGKKSDFTICLSTRLTPAGYFHDVTMAIHKDRTHFVSKYSNVSTKPVVSVFSVNFEQGNKKKTAIF